MSYTLVTSFCREFGRDKKWEELNTSAIPVETLLRNYESVLLVLRNNLIQGDVTFDLVENSFWVQAPTFTVGQWLTAMGNTTLPFIQGVPRVTTKTAYWRDAFQNKWKISGARSGVHFDVPATPADNNDLVLRHPTFSAENEIKNMLLFTSGICCRTSKEENIIRAIGAGEIVYRTQQPLVGYINFNDIGEVGFIPITEAMVSKSSDDFKLHQTAIINTNKDLADKTIFLSFCGILFALDDVVKYIGDGGVLIDTWKLDIKRLYLTVRGLVNLDLDTYSLDSNSIDINMIYSDDNLIKMLTNKHSFIITIDNSHLNKKDIALFNTGQWGEHYTYNQPKGYLRFSDGTVGNYRTNLNNGRFMLSHQMKKRPAWLFDDTELHEQNLLATGGDRLVMNQPDHGKLVEFSAEILTIE